MMTEIGLDGKPLDDRSIIQIKSIYLGLVNQIKDLTMTGTLSIRQAHPEDGLANFWYVELLSYNDPHLFVAGDIQLQNALHELQDKVADRS